MKLLIVSSPLGPIGSGLAGGVEFDISTLVSGLLERGHQIVVLAAEGSFLPEDCKDAKIWTCAGKPQASIQHQLRDSPALIAQDGLLSKFWRRVLSAELNENFDAVINLSSDWLSFYLTPFMKLPIFHWVTMGSVHDGLDQVIHDVALWDPRRLAFQTSAQAADFNLQSHPNILGKGLNLGAYSYCERPDPMLLGWVGRIAKEKGLEDAVKVAVKLQVPLAVWGIKEDIAYAEAVEASVPKGTIDWRGFLSTEELQKQLRYCRVLINTPKWNEAYGNVVIEALALGVPVVTYRRGGPGEIIQSGITGWLVEPDDVEGLAKAVTQVDLIDRAKCRHWVEANASRAIFSEKIENWIKRGICVTDGC